tara:strand:+ start:91 stop:507 length:417 start_codon:yes stop_codon:yes gene_type:complete
MRLNYFCQINLKNHLPLTRSQLLKFHFLPGFACFLLSLTRPQFPRNYIACVAREGTTSSPDEHSITFRFRIDKTNWFSTLLNKKRPLPIPGGTLNLALFIVFRRLFIGLHMTFKEHHTVSLVAHLDSSLPFSMMFQSP